MTIPIRIQSAKNLDWMWRCERGFSILANRINQMGELSVPTFALDLTLRCLSHAVIGIHVHISKGSAEERTKKESIYSFYRPVMTWSERKSGFH